jgi:ABC-type transport system involved in multi-copper enzyme maturation permease subunit
MNKTLALLIRALRTESRDIKSHLFRFGLAGVVVLILLMGLSAIEYESAPGRVMFKSMTVANWIFVTLAGGTFFSIAISEETEQQTLGLLRMANVGPLSLLLGKWLPRMLAAVVLISIQFPFTWLTVTLGGVSWQQIGASYLMLLAHLVLVGNLGLLSSVLNATSAKACAWTFVVMILVRILPIFCWAGLMLGAERRWLEPSTAAWFWDKIGAPLHEWSASGRLFGEILATSFKGNAWSPQVISNLAGGAVLFCTAWIVFDSATMRHMSGGPQRKSLLSRLLTRKTRSSSAAWSWALGWKDFRQVSGGMRSILIKYVLYGALFGLIFYINTMYDANYAKGLETSCGAMALILFWVLFPLELCFLAAKLFRPELNDHTWSTLLTLPKSLPVIAYSKLGGALLGLIPTVSVLGVCAMPFLGDILMDIQRDPVLLLVIAYGLACVAVALHLVTFFSISITWAAWPIAIILGAGVTFFGNMLVWILFGIGMMGMSGGGGNAVVYSWMMLLTCGHLTLAGVTHYGIGLRLVAKGAEN